MEIAASLGTRNALRKSTNYTKSRIKGGMRGSPRWGHKGPDKVTEAPAVKTGRTPDHIPRSGGPGRLTGDLWRSIRRSRKPRSDGPDSWSAVVMAGGDYGFQNRYKGQVEATNPYFKPGVDKAAPKVRGFFEASWAAAVNGKRI